MAEDDAEPWEQVERGNSLSGPASHDFKTADFSFGYVLFMPLFYVMEQSWMNAKIHEPGLGGDRVNNPFSTIANLYSVFSTFSTSIYTGKMHSDGFRIQMPAQRRSKLLSSISAASLCSRSGMAALGWGMPFLGITNRKEVPGMLT